MTREDFEARFDSRTLAYLPGFAHAAQPLVIVVGEAAHSPAGHALLVSLSNQVARAHRRIVFVGELDRPLLCSDVFGMGTLARATAGLASAINPFIELDVIDTAARLEPLLTIGVGTDVGVELALGCNGWHALLGPQAAVGIDETSILGALLASCLGANAALHRLLETREPSRRLLLPMGLRARVGSPRPARGRARRRRARAPSRRRRGRLRALDFFLSFWGIDGTWTIIDGDSVDVSNLNRQLLFTAADAGFPEGEPASKAKRAAESLGAAASFSPVWFHEDEAIVEGKYDLVLALANDYGVRSALQHRQPTVLMHATTSANWQSQLHRHVAGRDDCIDCRLPPDTARFACATEDVETPAGEHFDAAIPPLSAMAGLLLFAELLKLQKGALVATPQNFTAVELSTATPIVQRKIRSCRQGCGVRRPAELRQRIDAHSRWKHLDGAHAESAA